MTGQRRHRDPVEESNPARWPLRRRRKDGSSTLHRPDPHPAQKQHVRITLYTVGVRSSRPVHLDMLARTYGGTVRSHDSSGLQDRWPFRLVYDVLPPHAVVCSRSRPKPLSNVVHRGPRGSLGHPVGHKGSAARPADERSSPAPSSSRPRPGRGGRWLVRLGLAIT